MRVISKHRNVNAGTIQNAVSDHLVSVDIKCRKMGIRTRGVASPMNRLWAPAFIGIDRHGPATVTLKSSSTDVLVLHSITIDYLNGSPSDTYTCYEEVVNV